MVRSPPRFRDHLGTYLKRFLSTTAVDERLDQSLLASIVLSFLLVGELIVDSLRFYVFHNLLLYLGNDHEY